MVHERSGKIGETDDVTAATLNLSADTADSVTGSSVIGEAG